MDANKMRQSAAHAVSSAMQRGITMLLANEGRYGVPEAVHLALNTALAAMVPIVPFLVQRPNLTKEEAKEKGPEILAQLINRDSVLLACLIVSHMQKSVRVDPDNNDMDDVDGIPDSSLIGIAQEISFGPEVINAAVADWKTLTGKDPLTIFDNAFIKAAEVSAARLSKTFDSDFEKLLKNFKTPSSETLQ